MDAASRSDDRRAFALGASFAMAAFTLGAACTVTDRDAGELSSAAFLLDVAHPTGFPLDLALVRLAMLLPFGDVAFRAGLGVAAFMSAACGFASVLAARSATGLSPLARAAVALTPAVALVGSSTVLRAATAMEVYAGALALCLAALANATSTSSVGARTRTAALLVGVSAAMHTTARPAALVGLAMSAWPLVRDRRRLLRVALASAAFALAGAAVTAYLPLASRRNGPIDWGDPESLSSLARYLSARSIRDAYAHRILAPWRFSEDLFHATRQGAEDLRAYVAIGAAGLVLGARSTVGRALALVAVIDLAYTVAINPMGMIDRQTLFAAEGCFAAAAGVAVAWIAREVSARVSVIAASAAAAFALVTTDAAWAGRADGFGVSDVLGGAGALGALPPRAVALCESDDLCGASMYAQWVEGERPDVVVLPRQHLGEPTTWRRLDAERALTRIPRGGDGRQRLAWVVSHLGPRVRWEGADDADRVLTARIGGGESPVLGVVGAPPGASDEGAVAWVAARVAGVSGKGARSVGGAVLVAAGRRLAVAGIARGVPAWRAAITLNPEQVSAYTNLGVAAAREGRLDLAVTLTRRALELDPERSRAWRNLADFLSAHGDRAGADDARREAARRR